MGLSFFDQRIGAAREFRPAAPDSVGVDAAGKGPREKFLGEALVDALSFLGLKAVPGAEIRVGGANPGPGAAWLRAAAIEGIAFDEASLKARGFAGDDWRYFCLRTHYRTPLAFSWEALSAARADLAELRRQSAGLAGVTLEPSSRGKTGYLHRFREILAKDLDLPGALDCVWDGLRPGALSPGSRAAFLRETLPALGLGERPK